MPVEKTVRLYPAGDQQAFDILHSDNICLSGTSVTTGSGSALVLLYTLHQLQRSWKGNGLSTQCKWALGRSALSY